METQALFRINTCREFEAFALEVFRYQYSKNPVYREFCGYIGKTGAMVKTVSDIPFLPIEFFKRRKVLCQDLGEGMQFTSSGTTGSEPSRHYVSDIRLYESSFLQGFERFYGPVTNYTILALLPSYLEREGSSLIYMVQSLIAKSGQADSGFYLHDFKALKEKLTLLDQMKRQVLLIGVSFALLDFVQQYPLQLQNVTVMETGGMKGRRKELVREELHELLRKGFGVREVHSEYGMTELLSQAYSEGGGRFRTPPWMRVSIRDPEDPLSYLPTGKTGGINVTDLANVHSCSFVATQDLGKQHPDRTFEVLGRFDASDIRGCNLMLL